MPGMGRMCAECVRRAARTRAGRRIRVCANVAPARRPVAVTTFRALGPQTSRASVVDGRSRRCGAMDTLARADRQIRCDPSRDDSARRRRDAAQSRPDQASPASPTPEQVAVRWQLRAWLAGSASASTAALKRRVRAGGGSAKRRVAAQTPDPCDVLLLHGAKRRATTSECDECDVSAPRAEARLTGRVSPPRACAGPPTRTRNSMPRLRKTPMPSRTSRHPATQLGLRPSTRQPPWGLSVVVELFTR